MRLSQIRSTAALTSVPRSLTVPALSPGGLDCIALSSRSGIHSVDDATIARPATPSNATS